MKSTLRRAAIAAATFLSCSPFGPTRTSAAATVAPHPDAVAAAHSGTADRSGAGLIDGLPADRTTHGSFAATGPALGYTATAGTLDLRDADGKRTAEVFYVSYVADGMTASHRPVSFFFNGGPGAGTAFLHLGAAGPVALQIPGDAHTDGAHATLAPNRDSWLPFSDLVFIDAIGTGYSVPEHAADAPKQFWGVTRDGSAFANAIRLWLERNDRNVSPKYLVGESYGGVRSIETAWALQEEQDIIVDGLVMISPEIDISDDDDNPIQYAAVIPSYAAAAMDRAGTFTTAKLDDAYRYAFGPYAAALLGPLPTGATADALYAKVAAITGLPEPVVRRERGEIDPDAHDVRSRDGRLYSMYDVTQSIADPFPEGEDNDDSPDPTLYGYGRAYGNALVAYVGGTLGYRTDNRYRLVNDAVNKAWDYKDGDDPVAKPVTKLRKLLALDPSLRIFIAHGYFDAVCPYAGSRYIVGQLPVGQDRIRLAAYPGGHMLYVRPGSRAALARDVGRFIRADDARASP